jgi:hypothetical protein
MIILRIKSYKDQQQTKNRPMSKKDSAKKHQTKHQMLNKIVSLNLFLRVKVEDNDGVQMFDSKQKLGYLVKLYMMKESESPEEHLEQRAEESHTEHEQQVVGEV